MMFYCSSLLLKVYHKAVAMIGSTFLLTVKTFKSSQTIRVVKCQDNITTVYIRMNPKLFSVTSKL